MKARFGLLGEVLGYSLSPRLHETIFEMCRLEASYDLIEIPREAFLLSDTKKILSAYKGFNVTIPYKEMIIPLLDEIDPFAVQIGAVNTVLNRDGKFFGYNTDYFGFVETLKSFENKLGQKETAVILGSGGAAKMAVKGLETLGFKRIVIVSRNPLEASKKFEFLECTDYAALPIRADLMVNCTPIGQKTIDFDIKLDDSWFSSINFFYDLNYNPPETLLMKHAQSQGVQTINGLRMLAFQAIKAEEIWWNQSFDVDVLAEKVTNLIKSV